MHIYIYIIIPRNRIELFYGKEQLQIYYLKSHHFSYQELLLCAFLLLVFKITQSLQCILEILHYYSMKYYKVFLTWERCPSN